MAKRPPEIPGLEPRAGEVVRKTVRTKREMLDAMPAVWARRDEFLSRVTEAEGDVLRLADLMAEAILMEREYRSLDPVGLNGKKIVSLENLAAMHCMDTARAAYSRARGKNHG